MTVKFDPRDVIYLKEDWNELLGQRQLDVDIIGQINW